SRRLTNMVEELLEFSRIEDGRFTLNMESIDIKAEFEDAVFTYSQIFPKQGIALHHNECEEEFAPIPGDPQRLRQVFCNLLDNAAKHGGSGGAIQTAIARLEDAVCITIRDYGPGIPEEELPFVKRKFYKGSSKARGNGIGLAVCDEIVTRHGGQLDIANAPGGGCLVRIILPISAPSPAKPATTTGTLPLEDIRAALAKQSANQEQ
ncbi:MAG: HAMP domain-containing sensor histidine kinase, partial [Candidatus Onthomonas sp.]|nr:HAMP domain-containing sensor histidine kinase [Candidatus Onthomonas sp.]